MPAREPLAVWLYGAHVAVLERRRDELGLVYTDEARSRWPLNTPLVSLAMPVSTRRHHGVRVFAYFDGLLPEGEARRMIAHDLGIAESDTFSLLHALGRDSAGALVLQPLSEGPPPRASVRAAEPIAADDVARRISQLRIAPLGFDGKVRVSLPGIQHKLLLVRRDGGSWALPVNGAPSTHILKPAIAAFAASVENEAFCMRLARRVGLRAANVDVEELGGRRVLVVERFDRTVGASGDIERLHQEDAAQALSAPGARKYEELGGPSLRAVAQLLVRWRAPRESLEELARAVAFAITIGDADRHAKNVSVLHDHDGRIRLAPLYDVMCTRLYPNVSTVPGMFVHGKHEIDEIGPQDLLAEAVSWGMEPSAAREAVASVLDVLPAAIDAEAGDSPWAPPALVELLGERARRGTAGPRSATPDARVSGRNGRPAHAGAAADTDADALWVEPYRRHDGVVVPRVLAQAPVGGVEHRQARRASAVASASVPETSPASPRRVRTHRPEFPAGDVLEGDLVVRAFTRYLERTLAEAAAGTLQRLGNPLALPDPAAAVAVATGRRLQRVDDVIGRLTGMRVAFRGMAGRGPTGVVRRVPLTVFDRWDPAAVGPTPADFCVLAIVATFNEADIVDGLLSRLRDDGIRVRLIDNWSTDATYAIAMARAANDPGIAVERFPADGPAPYFELERLLRRVEEVAHASGADWVVNHDADEVRQSPWRGVSLRRALYCVEQFGFNCVDHVVMNFRPVDERWEEGGSVVDAFRWFEFGDHQAAFRQQKAWKPQRVPVRFASSGGHDADFPGRRVFPYRFLLRHYPIRSTAHGRRKVLRERQGRWSPEEREKGWHVHYDAYSEDSAFVWQPASLHRFTTLEDLDRRLLVERLSGAGLPENPFPGESGADDATPPPVRRPMTFDRVDRAMRTGLRLVAKRYAASRRRPLP